MATVDSSPFLHLARPLAPSSFNFHNNHAPLNVNIQPQVRRVAVALAVTVTVTVLVLVLVTMPPHASARPLYLS